MKIVKFKYCDEFHCIGPDCTDHCCKEWKILLGKREYLDYKKAECSNELKSVINTAFERVKNHEKKGIVYDEKSNYAQINFNKEDECPFHGADGLCMIQKELGEKALTVTCSTFPRLYGLVGGEILIFGCDITCPHVVELMIDHPEGLEVCEDEYDGSNEGVNRSLYGIPEGSKKWQGYSQYWTIKSAQIDILQNRNFTIPERLLMLGFFSKKADEYIEAGQVEKVETLYNMMLDYDTCKKIADSLRAPQSDVSAATKSANTFLKMYQSVTSSKNKDYITRLFEQTAQSIGVRNELLSDEDKIKTTCNFVT
ncbi:MAG: hypothetical protein HDT44_01835 [Ruminococcaceae bacterium]|nr:hypothetical protein [Oscillospiraceae bacterium]